MPISLILSLIGPILVSTATAIFQRLWKHGISTAQGTAAGAGAIALLNASGCDVSGLEQAGIGLIAALPGFLGTDSGKTDTPIWQLAADKIKTARSAVPVPTPPVA